MGRSDPGPCRVPAVELTNKCLWSSLCVLEYFQVKFQVRVPKPLLNRSDWVRVQGSGRDGVDLLSGGLLHHRSHPGFLVREREGNG